MSVWTVPSPAFTGSIEIVFIAVIVLVLLRYAWQPRNRNLPPGPRSWSPLSNLSLLRTTTHVALAELSGRYGAVLSLCVGRRCVVVLSDFAVIREAFVKQGDIFAGRPQLFIDDLSDERKGK